MFCSSMPVSSLSDLTMSRDGNDLVVQFKGIDDGVRIKDFALGSQVWELRNEDSTSSVIDDALIDGADVGVVDSAAAAIERYEASVEAIYYATLAPDSARGADGVFRRTTSMATNFSATTDYYNVAFARTEQISDGASIVRLSTPYVSTSLLLVWKRSQALRSMSALERQRWIPVTGYFIR